MTYAEAFTQWIEANPHSHVLPDHARSTLTDGVWHMRSAGAGSIPLGLVDDRTGRFMKEGT